MSDGLRALSEAATPGPWEAQASEDQPPNALVYGPDGDSFAYLSWNPGNDYDMPATAAFIVAAVNYVRVALSSPETTPAPDAAIIADEIVAYYKLYDFHEVWKHSGARALVDWLITRGIIPASPETTPAGVLDEAALREALEAIDLGLYPAASPAGPRTPWQDGWNAGATAMEEAVRTAALGRSGSGGGRG